MGSPGERSPLLPTLSACGCEAGAPPPTPLSHGFGTWHQLSHCLSFSGSSGLAGTHTLPAPLGSPGRLQIPGPGIPASLGSLVPSSSDGREPFCWVLPPSAGSQSHTLPKTKSRTGTFHIFSVDLFSVGPSPWFLCWGKTRKLCSQSPPPSGAREQGLECGEQKSPRFGEGSPSFLLPRRLRSKLCSWKLCKESAFISPGRGREPLALRWSQSGAH